MTLAQQHLLSRRGFAFASPSGAIPTDVFATNRIVNLNGATLVLKHYGPAHTDGDISVASRTPTSFTPATPS